MTYKKYLLTFALYFLFVFVSTLFAGQSLLFYYYYYNLYMYMPVIIFYMILPEKTSLFDFKVIRFKSLKETKKALYKHYTMINLIFSIGFFIINLLCINLVTKGSYDFQLKHLLYPIHQFIIFEIIYLFELLFMKADKPRYGTYIIYTIVFLFFFSIYIWSRDYFPVWNIFSGLCFPDSLLCFVCYAFWLFIYQYLKYMRKGR